MNFLLLTFALLLGGCASPPSMFYQRSEYKLDKSGGLVFSTSPRFQAHELKADANSIFITESWLIQNSGKKPETIFLEKALVKTKKSTYSLQCRTPRGQTQSLLLNAGEKDTVHCIWALPKNPRSQSDIWATFTVPTTSGPDMTSNKLIRVEDFDL